MPTSKLYVRSLAFEFSNNAVELIEANKLEVNLFQVPEVYFGTIAQRNRPIRII